MRARAGGGIPSRRALAAAAALAAVAALLAAGVAVGAGAFGSARPEATPKQVDAYARLLDQALLRSAEALAFSSDPKTFHQATIRLDIARSALEAAQQLTAATDLPGGTQVERAEKLLGGALRDLAMAELLEKEPASRARDAKIARLLEKAEKNYRESPRSRRTGLRPADRLREAERPARPVRQGARRSRAPLPARRAARRRDRRRAEGA